jgi:hypothetical protein
METVLDDITAAALRVEVSRGPGVGIHQNVKSDVYHAWDLASSHRLSMVATSSPLHMRWAVDNPSEPTDALVRGDATHVLTFQPDVFEERFIIARQCAANLSSAKTQTRCRNNGIARVGGNWFCGVHLKKDRHDAALKDTVARYQADGYFIKHVSPDSSHYMNHPDGRKVRVANHAPTQASFQRMYAEKRESVRVDIPPYGSDDARRVLSADQFDTARRIVDALRSDKFIRECIEVEGECEVSAIWDQPIEGTDQVVRCKMRADKIAGVLMDLKTARDGDVESFRRAAYDYGYHRQFGFYNRGMAAHGRRFEHSLIIAVEPEPPYSPVVYRLDDGDIDLGWDEIYPALKRYAWCEKHGVWPGYGFNYETEEYEVRDLCLPEWARRRARANITQE